MNPQEAELLGLLRAAISAYSEVDGPTHQDLKPQPVQIVINIFQAGAVAAPFTLANASDQGAVMSDQYNVTGAGAVGPKAKASSFTINQGNPQASGTLNLAALASELETLRQAMKKQADTVEQDASVYEIGQAQAAAAEGDEAKTRSHLKRAGQWAAGIAGSIGAGLAVAAIRSAIGL